MRIVYALALLFAQSIFLQSRSLGQGYIFYRNLNNKFVYGDPSRCTGGNYMYIRLSGNELQTLSGNCSNGAVTSLGNINQSDGNTSANYYNSSLLNWEIVARDGTTELRSRGQEDITLVENHVSRVLFEAKSFVSSWAYDAELLYTTDISPKIVTPGITNSKAVHTESVTIVAPQFLTSNFRGNDIVWHKDGLPIKLQNGDFLTGSSISINYKSDQPENFCVMHRYAAKSAQYNWFSGSIEIKFGPNLKVGSDLLIKQPKCILSQSEKDTAKTVGELSFGKSLGGRVFSPKIGAIQSGDLFNHETQEIIPSFKPIYLKTVEKFFPSEAISCPQYDTIFVLPPKPLSITNTSFHDIDCFGGTASYAVQLSGLAAKDTVTLDNTLKYALDRDKPFTIPNIPKGRHTLTVKDQNGCAMDTSLVFTATEPTKLVPNLTVKHPLCNMGNGMATILTQGGTSPYKYRFEKDSSYSAANLAVRAAGSRITPSVIDAKGCITVLEDTTLKTPADFFPTATATKHNRCYNDSVAEANITVKGNGRYVYAFDTSRYQNTSNLTSLPTGKLTLYARNDSGCVKTAKVTISSLPKIDLIKLVQTDVTCKGFSDGSLYVQVSGGRGTKHLSGDSLGNYSNKASAYNYTFQNLKAQAYRAIATDDSGCTQKLDFQLKTRSDMRQSFRTVAPTCVLSPNGEATVATLDGVKPYRYTWVGQSSKTNIQSNIPQGKYVVTTTDSLSCIKTDTVQLTANIQIPVKLTGYPILCKGQKLDLDPGHLGVAYTWKKGNKVLSTNRVLTVDTSGTYSVLVKDNIGCTGTDSFSVAYVPREIKPSFIMTSKAVVGDMVMIAFNNVGYQSLSWSDTIPNTIAMDTTQEKIKPYIFKQPGDYKIPMTMQMYGCKETIWKTIQIFPASEKQQVEESLGIKAKLVREVGVSPNPTRGEFNLKVDLNYENAATISLYSISPSHLIATKEVTGKSSYTITFNEELSQGFYMLYIKVGKETASYRVLVTND